MKTVLLRSLACVALISSLQAATINVPADFTSLQAALVAAASGDTIIVSTNGPFNEFIALYGSMASNITVSAAAGFSPVIEGKAGMDFTGGTPPANPIQAGVLVYSEHAINWIGFKFRINFTGLVDFSGAAGEKYHCKVAATRGGNVNFTNCVWEWANDPVDQNAINSHILRLEGDPPGGNSINFDHCQWNYVNMSPANLQTNITGSFTDSVGLASDSTFTDCSWQISPDTSGHRRHGVGALNNTVNTLHFLRCIFGDVTTNNPATDLRQGQAWCNLPTRISYFDQCKFGRGAGRVIATSPGGQQYINRCLFLPTRGNFTLNDPVISMGATIPTYFTNCVFQYRTTATGSTPINDFNGPGTGDGSPGRGSFVFEQCTYVDLDGAAGRTNRGFISVGDATENDIQIANCIISMPAQAGSGIIKNVAFTPAGTEDAPSPGGNITGTVHVYGTNMLLASSSYNSNNDVIHNAIGSGVIPRLADPLLAGDNIHLSVGSPAIDAGGNVGVLVDYDGNVRPLGLRPDIGATEGAVVAAVLTITQSGVNVVISWTGGGTLQAAPEAIGTYTNITGATSPYTYTVTGARTFFRTAQ